MDRLSRNVETKAALVWSISRLHTGQGRRTTYQTRADAEDGKVKQGQEDLSRR